MSLTLNKLRWAALASLLLLKVATAEIAPPVQQILLLQSFDRGSLAIDRFTINFRVDITQDASRNITQVVVGRPGGVGPSPQAIIDFIRSAYSNRRAPDLIVTIAGPAAVFARKYRQQLFPQTPLLFASIDRQYLADALGGTPLAENETAVTVAGDYPRFVDEILRVRPETREVFMVIGTGETSTFWRGRLEEQFKRFEGRVKFRWSDDLSLAEILRICASLPRGSAILYLTFGSDALGGAYADERVLHDLRATANAPLFAAHSVYFGHGIVGGSQIPMDELGRKTVEVAREILNGTSPSSLRVPAQPMTTPVFDWRELQRWDIDERRLPPESVVQFRRPSIWQEHMATAVTAAAVLAVQALLIAGLLLQRRARQRAEDESRKNLALAADASRRETMSALSHSIGHELGQPITSMMYNAGALKRMLATDHSTSALITEVVSDIHAEGVRATQIIERHRKMLQSRQMQRKPVDIHAIIDESLTLVAHELKTHRVETIVELPVAPCIVSGDQVLLQQVLVNLLMNAMDAMSQQPPTQRRITIRSEVRPTNVQIYVRDNGPGLPEKVLSSLFTAFVTTKSHGLGIGLTIVRTIVSAHEGKIEAHNNAEGGATFTFTLPRSEARNGATESPPITEAVAGIET